MYRRLVFAGGVHFDQGQPLPSPDPKPTDPRVWLILFQSAYANSVVTSDDVEEGAKDDAPVGPSQEERWGTPAKYLIYMCEADGTLKDKVEVHEVWADKVHIASRFATQDEAIDEIEEVLRGDLGDEANAEAFKARGALLSEILKQAARSNGQASAAAAAP